MSAADCGPDHPNAPHGESGDRRLNQDLEHVLGDFDEAIATGREPEVVQAERHARERRAVERRNAGAGRMKRWFNRRWPYLRRCTRRWCLRGQVYDHRCHRHQDLA